MNYRCETCSDKIIVTIDSIIRCEICLSGTFCSIRCMENAPESHRIHCHEVNKTMMMQQIDASLTDLIQENFDDLCKYYRDHIWNETEQIYSNIGIVAIRYNRDSKTIDIDKWIDEKELQSIYTQEYKKQFPWDCTIELLYKYKPNEAIMLLIFDENKSYSIQLALPKS